MKLSKLIGGAYVVFHSRVELVRYAVWGLWLIRRMPKRLFFNSVPMFWIRWQFGVAVGVIVGVFVTVGVLVGVFVIVGVSVIVEVGVTVGVSVAVPVGVIVGVYVTVGKVIGAAALDRLQAGSLNCTLKPKWLELRFNGAEER